MGFNELIDELIDKFKIDRNSNIPVNVVLYPFFSTAQKVALQWEIQRQKDLGTCPANVVDVLLDLPHRVPVIERRVVEGPEVLHHSEAVAMRLWNAEDGRIEWRSAENDAALLLELLNVFVNE